MTNQMRYASRGHGDIKVSWDPKNKEEVKAAKQTFDDLIAKGYRAWRVDLASEKRDESTQLAKFDPEAKDIVVLPPLTGG